MQRNDPPIRSPLKDFQDWQLLLANVGKKVGPLAFFFVGI